MKVDFYILSQTKNQQSMTTVCQLIENSYIENKKIYVQTMNASDATLLDQLLWTYKDISFIPHAVNESAPIQISEKVDFPSDIDVLINLSDVLPNLNSSIKHIMEIVFNDANLQQQARERYKKYRELNCELNTYKM